jgi:flagella basal body P-ring formation protein FlgA
MRTLQFTMRGAMLFALAAPCAWAQGDAVRMELRPLVQVAAEQVTLGEVAALSTANLSLLKRLMALPIGPAPHAGETLRLDRATLARWVQVRTGTAAQAIEWQGAAVAEVQRVSSVVSGERLASAARETLRDWLGSRSTRAEINLTATPRDVTVPAGMLTVKARPIPPDQPIGRRAAVWLDLWVEGRFVRTVPVGFEVTAFGPAYVAADDAPAGTPLQAAHVEVREVELSGRGARPLPVRDSALPPMSPQQQLTRFVSAGQVVGVHDVQPRPAVARGDWVALRIHAGAMELESRAEALQNGRAGQTVSVKPHGASGILEARVLGPGRVELTP